MAIFSDLANELIIHIWGYVIEPESVESFARVSKRVHGLATPFVREHVRLKRKYSKVYCSDYRTGTRPAILVKTMLLNPRIAFYIDELRIEKCSPCWDRQRTPYISSYPTDTMDLFKDAIRYSSLIAPSEIGCWVADIETGDAEPILALLIMQLTKLNKLKLYDLELEDGCRLLETLRRMTGSTKAIIHPGPSTVGSEVDSNNQDFTQPLVFSNIKHLTFDACEIGLDDLSRLLRNKRTLKTFCFSGSYKSTIEPFQIVNELLACSQNSLQKLCLETTKAKFNEPGTSYMGDITRFESLAALEIDFVRLLGSKDETCRRLVDVLPMSIERVILQLFSLERISSETLRDVVLDMVKSKTDCLPNLKTLTFNAQPGGKWDNKDLMTELEGKAADVGVLFTICLY